MFDAAFEAANPPGDADPELDLQGLPSPLWGHHSLRRFADTCARQTMVQTGATEQDIDLVFGWMEAFYVLLAQGCAAALHEPLHEGSQVLCYSTRLTTMALCAEFGASPRTHPAFTRVASRARARRFFALGPPSPRVLH